MACPALGEGVTPLRPGLYTVTTTVETESADPGTGTVLDTWRDTYTGAACLMTDAERRIRPETFADDRCSFSDVRPDPYGEAYNLVCAFPEGLLAGSGSLAVDPALRDGFTQSFTIRGEGEVASQRVTIRGTHQGDCLPESPLAGP